MNVGTMHMGTLIREARLSCGLTQVQLAGRLHCTQAAINQLEARENVESRKLEEVAAALGLRLEIKLLPPS